MQQSLHLKKKEIVSHFLKKGVLLSNDLLEKLSNDDEVESLYASLSEIPQDALIINKDVSDLKQTESHHIINWRELERTKALEEKTDHKIHSHIVQELKKETPKEQPTAVQVITSYNKESRKREVKDFVDYFNNRYKALEQLLKKRSELSNTIAIRRVLNKKDKENITIIGIVFETEKTKNGNIMLTLEDKTGAIKVLINKNKPEMFKKCEDIVHDEVIGVMGVNGNNIVFANEIVWPDLPITELKKSPDEAYAIFISDIHVGSNQFLPADFNKFLRWINQDMGNDTQRHIASKVKYIFIGGDLVDGIGIYPGQEDELTIPDIYRQYEECAKLLARIPDNIHKIICPGNHDVGRIAEPQPPLQEAYTKALYEIPNTTIVSNPSIVKIHASDGFPGFLTLLYHGYSFDHYIANVSSLRNQGGYDRADLIMRFLLERRHLAPTHTSTLYIPDSEIDPLVIEKIPDFFFSGHIHKSVTANYKNTTMICGSCWQAKTAFQEKVGHNPEPSRVPIVNLQTREVKILRFGD